jgi:hypothetical protein
MDETDGRIEWKKHRKEKNMYDERKRHTKER